MTWPSKIYDYTVEKFEIHRPGGKPYYPMNPTPCGVLHTTEGKTVDSALRQLKMSFSAPLFVVGDGRIVQCRPLGVQGAALHAPANQRAYCQIEIVGFSRQQLWLPDDPSLKPLIATLAFMSKDIPLRVPNSWPDDCSDLKGEIWASNNSRRRKAAQGAWNSEPGWWMHLEVPDQGPTWHWDAGALRRSAILTMASQLASTAVIVEPPVIAPSPRSFDACARELNLPALIATDYPWYGQFTQDAANLIVLVAALENCPPEMLAVTWLNESKFNFYPQPNMKNPDPAHWDVGPCQLNVFWTRKVMEAGQMRKFNELEIFGSVIQSPCPEINKLMFTGNPMVNLQAAAGRLLALNADNETRVVKFTGPDAQPYRLESWRKYGPLFKTFFENYRPYRVGG